MRIFDLFKSKPKKKIPPKKRRIAPPPKPELPKRPIDIPPNEKTVDKIVARQNPEKEFLKIFKQLTYRHRPWEIWKSFIIMTACSISNSLDKAHYDEREALYLRTIKQYSKKEQILFPELVAWTVMALEENMEQDFLGRIFMDLNLGNDAGGQFFTPYSVSGFMAVVGMEDVVSVVNRNEYITINDPCCGSGVLLIASIHEARRQLKEVDLNFQNHVLVSGQDIDFITALMCYIQISLLGVAGYFKVGNSLTDPIRLGDKLDDYWFTPMYFSDIWVTRRLCRKTEQLFERK